MVVRHKSENGMRIVLEKMPNVRSVTIGIWILTGSRNETEKNNGIAHFLEHMFFKGTNSRSPQDIAEAFDSIGGQVNAFTSKEFTCLYARVLDSHKDYALEVLTDMFFHSTFLEEELEKEKKVVMEEIKMYEDTPDDLVHDLLAQASYGNHSLAFPILGTDERIHTFSKESLSQFMNEQYVPENVVVSVAGNVEETFIQEIEGSFNQFKTSASRKPLKQPSFLPKDLERNKDTEQAHLCLGYDGLPIDDEEIYSLVLMNNVLGGSMSSRLFQEIREQRGLAYSVFSYHSAFLDNGLLTIYAGTGKEQLTFLKSSIQHIIDELLANGITDKELKNSKEQLKGNMMLSLESTSSRMSRNAKNELLLNRHRTMDEVINEVEAIDHGSVKSVIETVFNQSPSSALVKPVSSS